jgi:O-antigen/teichoic acid export membrane protein
MIRCAVARSIPGWARAVPDKILAQRARSAHELVLMINRQALNIIANFSGVGARLIFSLVFNIIYFRLLGSESYGLIGFYTSLAALSTLFDLGLNQTVVREVARRGADGERAGELRTVVFTLQLLLGGIGLVLGLLVALAARWIATSWFSAAHLATDSIAASVALMGGALALLFPANVFYGVLTGLQRQVLSNSLIVAATAFRGVLTIAALFAFGPGPVIFFSAQIVASAAEVGILCLVIPGLLPPSSQRLRFDVALLGNTWKFSAGTWLAVTFAQIAMLGDKIILSTLLPLHLFGLYSLAVTVTSTIQRLAAPFSNVCFPYFVSLKEQNRAGALLDAYRTASEFASAIFLAAGLLLIAYATPVAQLLSTDAADTARLGWLIALLAAANTLNVEMALPFSLLFAHGITAVALRINFALCVLYPTALVLLVPRYGPEAAAALWLAANVLMLPVLIALTHRLILPGQAWQWLLRTVLLPGCGAALTLVAGSVVMPDLSPPPTLIWIGLNGVLALAAALLCAPETRSIILARIGNRRGDE